MPNRHYGSAFAPQDHTYFIVAPTNYDREVLRWENPQIADGESHVTVLGFHRPSMYPVRVATVVLLNAGLRNEFPDHSMQPYDAWSIIAHPQGIAVGVNRQDLIVEFSGTPIWIDGELQVSRRPAPYYFNRFEDIACHYVKLLVAEAATSGTEHAFLTTGHRARYHVISCYVRLIKSWTEVRHWDRAFDDNFWDSHRVNGKDQRNLLHKDRRFTDRFEDHQEQARLHGPHAGSFIPCSIWSSMDRLEPDCVLEVCRAPAKDRSRECRLHVLSDTDDVRLYPGQSLRSWGEIKDASTGKLEESICDIGQVSAVGDAFLYPSPTSEHATDSN